MASQPSHKRGLMVYQSTVNNKTLYGSTTDSPVGDVVRKKRNLSLPRPSILPKKPRRNLKVSSAPLPGKCDHKPKLAYNSEPANLTYGTHKEKNKKRKNKKQNKSPAGEDAARPKNRSTSCSTAPMAVVQSNFVQTNSPVERKVESRALGTSSSVDTTKHLQRKPAMIFDEHASRFPVLKDHELMKKILEVPISNNQKGRIRQVLRDIFSGASKLHLPELINNKITHILQSSKTLTDTDLRKLRILHNMLKKSLVNDPDGEDSKKSGSDNSEEDTNDGVATVYSNSKAKEKEHKKKLKGPKRYVVFIGNLPLDVEQEQIREHFADLQRYIKSVRVPTHKGKKTGIAYLELANEPSYELALSKHHTMLGKRRINVHYTTQKKTKISVSEAKSKTAKLIAMQESGQLLGSIPKNKKRSARRAKAKRAQKLAASQEEA